MKYMESLAHCTLRPGSTLLLEYLVSQLLYFLSFARGVETMALC